MINRKTFFDEYRAKIDPNRSLSQREVDAISIFLDMFEKNITYFEVNQWAYVFATVFHETGASFEPCREAFYLIERYGWNAAQYDAWAKKHFRYYPLYGRGYVQLTWPDNYDKYGKKLGIDLRKHPDVALRPKVAFFVLIDGFKLGEFRRNRAGKPYRISDFINRDKTDYINARNCINGGLDRAHTIAAYARTFEAILRKSLIRT